MDFLYDFHHFYMYSSEIDLHKNPRLRLLQLDLNFRERKLIKLRDDAIRWFDSICKSVTSKSLVIEVRDFSEKAKICNKIQDTLLALNARIGTLAICLLDSHQLRVSSEIDVIRKLFPRLCRKGIVIKRRLSDNESVCGYFFTSKLPY